MTADRVMNIEEWCAEKMESTRRDWGWLVACETLLDSLSDDELLALVDFRKARRALATPPSS